MKTQQEGSRRVATDEIQLKVAGGSNSSKVAGAIVNYLMEGTRVSLIAMGAGAVNQSVKAIAIARGMAAPHGHDLYCIPAFKDEIVDGVQKSAMVFWIKER